MPFLPHKPSCRSSWVFIFRVWLLTGAVVIYPTRGSATSSSTPGPRTQSTAAADTYGNLYLWGGTAASFLGDVWSFSTTSLLWKYLAGSSSMTPSSPDYSAGKLMAISGASVAAGGRMQGVCWWSNNTLYLFGGSLSTSELSNDLYVLHARAVSSS
jgi:hypothetical protein